MRYQKQPSKTSSSGKLLPDQTFKAPFEFMEQPTRTIVNASLRALILLAVLFPYDVAAFSELPAVSGHDAQTVGDTYAAQNKHDLAEHYFQLCLDEKKRLKVVGDGLANSLSDLAVTKSHLNRFEEAEQLYLNAIDETSSQWNRTLQTDAFATFYMTRNRNKLAEKLLLSCVEDCASRNSPIAKIFLDYLAGKERLTDSCSENSRKILQEVYFEPLSKYCAPEDALVLNNLGILYCKMGKFRLSSFCFGLSMAAISHSGNYIPLLKAAINNNYALLKLAQQKPEEAKGLFTASLKVKIKNLNTADPDLLRTQYNFGRCLQSSHRNQLADRLFTTIRKNDKYKFIGLL